MAKNFSKVKRGSVYTDNLFTNAKISIPDALRLLNIPEISGSKFLCPSHDDRTESADYTGPDNQKWVCRSCNAGGSAIDLVMVVHGLTKLEAAKWICDQMGLNVSMGRKAGSKKETKAKPVHPTEEKAINACKWQVNGADKSNGLNYEFKTTYPYHNSDGTVLSKLIRFESKSASKSASKEVRWISPVEGGWTTSKPDLPDSFRWPLYRQNEIDVNQPVVVVEGEKAADAAREMGLNAVTWNGGVTQAKKTEWSILAGIPEVIIWPDHDKPKAGELVGEGLKAAHAIAKILTRLPSAPAIRILPLDDVKGLKYDAADVLKEYGSDGGRKYFASRVELSEPIKEGDDPVVDSLVFGSSDDYRDLLELRNPDRMARDFLRESREQGKRLIMRLGVFMTFNGSYYEPTDTKAIRSRVATFVANRFRATPELPEQHIKTSDVAIVLMMVESQSVVDGVEDYDWIDPEQKPGWWSPDPCDIVACRNCLLDMFSLKTVPITDSVFLFGTNDIEWKGIETPSPRFDDWLAQVQPTEENQRQLRWLLGYTLYGDNPLSKLFYFFGPARTGKGSFIRYMERLAGLRNVCATDIIELSGPFGLEGAIGKRLMTYSDYRPGHDKLDLSSATGTLLSITGRDTQPVRRKHKPPLAVRLKVKYVMASNAVFSASDTSGVIAKRFHVIEFGTTFEKKEDADLDARIWAEESSGILASAVRGFRDFKENGFNFPETHESREMVEMIRATASPLGSFKQDCLIEWDFLTEQITLGEYKTAIDGGLNIEKMHKAVVAWLKSCGHSEKGWTINRVRNGLKELGVQIIKKVSKDGSRSELIRGFMLNSKGKTFLDDQLDNPFQFQKRF